MNASFEQVRKQLVAARLEFMSQLARLPRELLNQPATAEAWSPLPIALHLYLTDGPVLDELQRLQHDPEAQPLDLVRQIPVTIAEIGQDLMPLESILAGMAARREKLYQYLSSLPEAAWQREIVHPRAGRQAFLQLVKDIVFLDQLHTQSILSYLTQLSSHNEQ